MSHGPKVRLHISYDGTAFGGWQKQTHTTTPTVQGTLEAVLSRIFDEKVRVIGASRTDAGVHALNQVAHFVAPKPLANYKILRSLNGLCPDALVVKSAWHAPDDFHALASSTGKTYRFLIHNSPLRSALRRERTEWVRQPLDLHYLNHASSYLIGEHDFKSFQSSGTPVKSTVRTVHGVVWRLRSPQLVEFSITGSGFLKQMVRNIVGTLLDLHQNSQPPEMIKEILGARDRQAAKRTAEPQGLYLVKVYYPEDLDNRCRKL